MGSQTRRQPRQDKEEGGVTTDYLRVTVSDIPAWVARGWRVAVPRTFGATVEWVWMKRGTA